MEKTPQRIMRELSQPFTMDDLEWRVQQAGSNNNGFWARIIAYVTNRAIQQRLDDVVGAFGWRNEFSPLPNSVGDGAMCALSIKSNSEWITKHDGAENTQIEAIKGGLSGAMKRAAVHWGIGRYLYDVEAMYALCISDEQFKKLKMHEKEPYDRAKTKDGKFFYWMPKKLDDKFLPQRYITVSTVKTITDLAEETHTKIDDILNNYGVDNIRDLFSKESGDIVSLLLHKKKRIEEEKHNEK